MEVTFVLRGLGVTQYKVSFQVCIPIRPVQGFLEAGVVPHGSVTLRKAASVAAIHFDGYAISERTQQALLSLRHHVMRKRAAEPDVLGLRIHRTQKFDMILADVIRALPS